MIRLCPDCDPLPIAQHHWNERLSRVVDRTFDALFLGITQRRWFMRLTQSMSAILVGALSVLRVFHEEDIIARHETSLYNRTLVVLNEARKQGLRMRIITCFGRCTKFFVLYHRNGSRIVFDELPTISLREDDVAFTDKYVFKKSLIERGLPTPLGEACRTVRQACIVAEKRGYPLVVKPVRGSLSKHTTCNITNREALAQAVKRAQILSREFLVEQHISGDVYRITLVGGVVRGCCRREAPNVIGDGIHSIAELVREKNSDPRRGSARQKNTTLHHIALTAATHDLLKQCGTTLQSVPAVGEKIYLHSKVILAAGADIHDCTDALHEENQQLFETVARMWDAPLMGIDALFQDISMSWREQKCAIIEANSKPYIDMHHVPVTGAPRNIAKPLIHYFLENHL